MIAPHHPALADIIRIAVGDRIVGLRTGMPLQKSPDGPPPVPQFERRVWFQAVQEEKLAPLPPELLSGLTEDGTGDVVFVDTFLPAEPRTNRGLAIRKDGRRYPGSAAVIHHVLEGLPVGTTVAFLAPVSVTTTQSCQDLRANIDEGHGVTWLIFADGSLLPGVHHAFQFVILVLVVGTGPAHVTRLADLRGIEPASWSREMQAARKRGGGEVGASVVLRDARLGCAAWTYERWTNALSDSTSDSEELGELRPLVELVDSVVVGLSVARDANLLQAVGDEEEAPDGFVPLIGGGEVRPDGIALPGRFWARLDSIPARAVVAEGDLLLRGLVSSGPSGPKLVGAVVPTGLDAAIGHHVLRLRWKEEITPQARDLLTSWLLSERASKSLAASGVGGVHLPISVLLQLQVPHPSETVVAALEALAALENWYRTRAESVRNARQAVFSASRYGEAVPLLLQAQQNESERVTAAEDSQRFAYRVRNYFPHPVALRREHLQVDEHGKERLEDTLECAEHLFHYLAVCGLVQLKVLRPDEALPSRHLQSTVDGDSLRFSWGSSWSVLKEAVDATRKLKDPLVAPIPQLALLADLVGKPDSAAGRAEAELRLQRNNGGHLHRVPVAELVEKSKQLGEALDELLKAVGFLGEVPLVYVRDYALDGFTGERIVELDLLRGASVVFDRSVRVVDRELPRDSLGLFGHGGEFHSLSPWLSLHACEVCKRPEVFIFNRCDRRSVTFVAMETGHPWENKQLSGVFSKILTSPSAR